MLQIYISLPRQRLGRLELTEMEGGNPWPDIFAAIFSVPRDIRRLSRLAFLPARPGHF